MAHLSIGLPGRCLPSCVVHDFVVCPARRSSCASFVADPTRYGKRPIVFAIDDEQRCVRFFGGVCVNGASYDLFRALGDQFRFHAENEGHGFVRWERLTDTLRIIEHTLRQRILRSRRALSRQFREKLGWTLDQNEIIENDRWQGYRLNPRLLLVAPSQLGSFDD